MSQFIETIKLHDGTLGNLSFHQSRFERTRREAMGLRSHPLLVDIIQVPGGLESGLFKCRVIYDQEINRIEFEPQAVRVVNTIRMVISDKISYGFKYVDRSELVDLFGLRGSCDDILILKKGFVTDSYYANVALWDGSDWHTPDTPLLPGTMRASLLSDGSLSEKQIRAEDLYKYKKIRLINAMNNLRESTDIPIENIVQ